MPRGEGIARFFMEHALPDSGGRNVVNVILVDFRGFDTMGEITVVGIVALAVYKLLRRFRPAPESMPMPHGAQRATRGNAGRPDPAEPLPRGYMRVPAVLGRLLLPVAGVISVFFLLRGHNAPGGGFVGGLVMATGFIVQYMVSGTLWIESRMRIHPQYCDRRSGCCARRSPASPRGCASRNFLTNLDLAWTRCRCSASCTCRARCCSTSVSIYSWSGATTLMLDRAGAPVAAQPAPARGNRHHARAAEPARRQDA